MNVVDHKCPNCTATLKFNPKSQKWECEYCRSIFELEDLEKNAKKYEKATSKPLQDLDIYTCQNCGAEIIADTNTTSTFCVYCKSTAIIKNRLVGAFAPDKIIPFKTTKEDAIEAFKNVGIRKILMPKEFSNKKNIAEMKGVYIPFWLFDFECTGNISGKATKVKSWSSGSYRYTQTDYYFVERGGTISFDNIPVDGSKNFDNAIMNSIEPFHYTGLKDFNYSYLSGFYAEKYDQNNDEVRSIGLERAKNTIRTTFEKDLTMYTTKTITKEDINIENESVCYCLLPVWLLNIEYKDKIHTFAMNGQTGKMIGNIPIDKKKTIIFAISLTLLISLIIIGVMVLFGGYSL